ncbi:SET domain-containing protein, partial [Aureobasidium melanogenum]
MSRRYPVADVYDERDRDPYARPRPARNYDDIEVDINRTRYADRPETVVSDRRSTRGPKLPDFLHDDYGRTNAGPLVVKNREVDDYADYVARREVDTVSRRGGERVERDELVIRDRRAEPPPRERPPPSRDPRDIEREEIIFRRGEREQSRPPRPRDRGEIEETDILIRRREQERERDPEPPRGPPDIVFRRGAGERRPPPRSEAARSEVADEEIIFRHEERRSPPPPARSVRNVEREEISIRERERSLPPPRRRSPGPLAREREEWLFRRREPSLPPPPRDEREEIIIRRREHEHPSPPPVRDDMEEIIIRRRDRSVPREPSPEPVREPTPEPPPPPPPEPIVRPPIIQEIITHHRHIDHGIERARSPEPVPSPPPAPPSPPPAPKDESLEIEIRRRNNRNGGYDENITFEREVSRPARPREPEIERNVELTRSRSVSAPQRRYDDEIAAEAEYYNRKALERGYMGEAYNGATRDWGLVDIPPGTRRVQMDGLGGARQDITRQQYNGSRRSKFYTADEEFITDFGPGGPAPERKEEKRKPTKDMWTEVAKDLVIKEAIEEMGYQYEDSEHFFYVMEYLKYEDVLQLVELTEDIRRERRDRIREIEWEREQLERLPPPKPRSPPAKPRSKYDERIYEHMPPRRDTREVVIQKHNNKATDRTSKWHLLSRSEHRDPPCTKPLADLKILRLSQLRMRSKASRSVIIVRTICQPRYLGPLLPILNVVEDDTGKAMHIEVYFSSTVPEVAILASGEALAIKAPRLEMSRYGPVIKVIHPSDIMILPQGHELMPKAFSREIKSAPESLWDWKEHAKATMSRSEYTKAIVQYSKAIECSFKTKESSDVSGALHHKRSIAAMRAGHYDLSISDALTSLVGRSDEDFKEGGRKFLFQAASAASQKHNYPLAQILLERLLKLLSTNERARIMSETVAKRLREERDGDYDISSMQDEKVPLDHASFINLTEIRVSPGRGRGLFLKADVKRGDLILCEKAFGYTQPVGVSNKNAYSSRDQGAQLWIDIVRKISANPSQAQRLLALHGNSTYKSTRNLPVVDGQAIIDVFQVKDIIDYNSFSYEVSSSTKHAHCLYIQASYMNHSCVENTFRSFIGDMIFIRAINDMSAGTELTTSYWPATTYEPERRSILCKDWDFDCECPLCTAEVQCKADWIKLFADVRQMCAPNRSQVQTTTVKNIEKLIKKLDNIYPERLFADLPRIGMQDLQYALLSISISLNDNAKIRKHAVAYLRERGFWIEKTSDQTPKIQLRGTYGMPCLTVSTALYYLFRVCSVENQEEEAEAYLALAKQMYLLMNGTVQGWEDMLQMWGGA